MPETTYTVSIDDSSFEAALDRMIAKAMAFQNAMGTTSEAQQGFQLQATAARNELKYQGKPGVAYDNLSAEVQRLHSDAAAVAFAPPAASKQEKALQALRDAGDQGAMDVFAQRDQDEQARQAKESQAQSVRQNRQEYSFTRRAAGLQNRGIDPAQDTFFRREVAASLGVEPDAPEVASRISEFQTNAMEAGMLRAPSFRASRRMVMGTAAGFAALQLEGPANTFAGNMGAGEPFRPLENLGGLLGGIGALSALIPGVGLAAAPIAMTLGAVGGMASNYFQRSREFAMTESNLSNFSGTSLESVQNTIRGLNVQGFTGPVTGEQMIATFQATQAARLGGATQAQSEALATGLLRNGGGELSPEIAKSLAPFVSNPYLMNSLVNTFSGIRTGSRYDEDNQKTISGGTVAEMVLTGGLPATVEALNRTGFGSLSDNAIALNTSLIGNQYAGRNTAAGTGLASSAAASLAASGIAPDTSQYIQAQKDVVASIGKQRDAIEAHIKILQDSGQPLKETATQIHELQAQSAQLGASMATMTQAIHVQATQFRTERLTVAAGIESSEAAREAYSLAPGSVAPSLTALTATTRARLSDAQRRANDMTLPAEQRLQAEQDAEAARTALQVTIPRQRDYERLGIPLLLSQGFSARNFAQTQQAAGFGALEETVAARLGGNLQETGRTRGRAEGLLQFMEGHRDRYGNEDIEQQRNQVFALDQQIREMRHEQAMERIQGPIRTGGYALSEAQTQSSFTRSMGLGQTADIEAALRNAGAAGTFQQTLLDAAAKARTANPILAQSLTNQATLLGTSTAQGLFEAKTSPYSFSSRENLSYNSLGLAISLQEQNPFSGGMVPRGERQARVGQIGGMLGQMDAYADSLPAGTQRDAFLSNNFGKRAGLLQDLQQQQIALTFGEIGHLVNQSFGSTGNFMMFGTPTGLPSVGMYQHFNPGGLPALGGSGRNVGLDPVSQMALGQAAMGSMGQTMGPGSMSVDTLAGAMGMGTQSQDFAQTLTDLTQAMKMATAAIAGMAPASGSVGVRAQLGNDPAQQAKNSASGLPSY